MSSQPATKRSVVLVIVLAMVSVTFLAIATRANEKRSRAIPAKPVGVSTPANKAPTALPAPKSVIVASPAVVFLFQ